MPTLDRRFLFGNFAAVILPGLLLWVLIGSPTLLADAWELRWVKPIFPDEQRCEAALDAQLDAVRRREEARRALVRELAEGRSTLLEAAARSRDLDRRSPDFPWEAFRRGHPAGSEDERHWREVIAQLHAYEPLGAGPTEELARRLEGEMAEHMARGSLCLAESGE